MSRENVEVALAGMEAWSRRDLRAMLELLDPEVEWHPAFQKLLGGEAVTYHGHDGVRELMRDTDEIASAVDPVMSEVYDLGDRVAAVGRLAIRGRESGIEIDSPVGVVADFREGKLLCIRTYLGHTEALEAAGLRE
ncbi:MAG TPA: nuclear transport factor 2 family protein [Solirubrobacterales bacterium]|nr:nuclear transport factor 2 family protein [Solirubrobacterales bacterium]